MAELTSFRRRFPEREREREREGGDKEKQKRKKYYNKQKKKTTTIDEFTYYFCLGSFINALCTNVVNIVNKWFSPDAHDRNGNAKHLWRRFSAEFKSWFCEKTVTFQLSPEVNIKVTTNHFESILNCLCVKHRVIRGDLIGRGSLNKNSENFLNWYVPNASQRAWWYTTSILRWSIAGLNSERSFPKTKSHSKVQEISLSNYLTISEWRVVGFIFSWVY